MKPLKTLEFGFVDAANYRRRENKDLFNRIFVKGEYLDELCEPNISFLIGEKGTGKTAYAVYLTNNFYKNIHATTKFVRETDYSKFIQLKKARHLTVSDFTSIWKVILYLLISNQIKCKENGILSSIFNKFKALDEAINEYYYGAFDPEIVQAITLIENSKEAAEMIFGKFVKLGEEESQQITFTESKFQANLGFIARKFKDALSQLKLKDNHILFIDGIDIRPSQIPFDEYHECVKGLANAIWMLNNDIFPSIKDSKGRMRVVLLIRPDIFDSLGLQNQNTKLQDNSVFLDWRTDYKSYRSSKIFGVFDHLLRTQQEKQDSLEKGNSWDYYFPWNAPNLHDEYKNLTSFISFLRKSYYRPRDILQMLTLLQKNKKSKEDYVVAEDFDNTSFQREYSIYLLGEIKDHLLFYYSQSDYQNFLKFFEFLNGKDRFKYSDFLKAFERLKKHLQTTSVEIPKFMSTANEFLQFLFDLNVIAYLDNPEDETKPYIHWCFKDRNYANISPKIKTETEYLIFSGLSKALDVGTPFKNKQ
ncbi:TPA: funZ protein [Neisseria meningitidis]|uniref:P-loop ATPase, Sll1717 family n=1 Tax=Neisseria meningitidis TaxID=487 RepID=UPI000E58964C|nr:funZ protein [Neisseria meningitidis]MBG8726901.1 funZ protein [Neisseria meningitidis]